MSAPDFYWQLVDADRPAGEFFREGEGFDDLATAISDLAATEAELTPEGFTPSGNISIYWSRRELRT